jgi:hypothetical protein
LAWIEFGADWTKHFKRFWSIGQREGSSSFLKKRTKKLFLFSVRTDLTCRVNQQIKSFLVLFFKKELLPCWPSPEGRF